VIGVIVVRGLMRHRPGLRHRWLIRNGLVPRTARCAARLSAPADKDDQMNHEQMNGNGAAHRGGVRWSRTAVVVAAITVTAQLAAACGSSTPPSGSVPGPSQNTAVTLSSFASCMRSHGDPTFYFIRQTGAPSPPPSTETVIGVDGYFAEFDPSSSGFQSAQKACQHILPFDTTSGGTETHQQFLSALKAAACMRRHGYPNWPDPNQAAPGVSFPSGIDMNSTQFQAAAKTCGVTAG
jgi:hypothetical protein